MAKFELKQRAQRLRKQGYSLKEICQKLDISKSTASLWCKGFLLTKDQSIKLSERANIKSYQGALRGALTNRRKSEEIKNDEANKAQSFIGKLSEREICIIGTALYWAEGNKTGRSFGVVNSDYVIILATMRWLEIEFGIKIEEYLPRLFINSTYKDEEKVIKKYWSKLTNIPVQQFRNTIFINSKHKKIYDSAKGYVGVMHLRVKKSSKVFYRTLAQIKFIKAQILKNV